MPWREIEAFLRRKERWIVAKLDEWSRSPRPSVLHGESGETLPLFGKTVVVNVHEGARAVKWHQDQLIVHAPRSRVLKTLVHWLKARALEALKPRTDYYAGRLDLPAPRVALSSARRQWGLCSEDGAIRLSWRLVHLDPRWPITSSLTRWRTSPSSNHSKRFWSLVPGKATRPRAQPLARLAPLG